MAPDTTQGGTPERFRSTVPPRVLLGVTGCIAAYKAAEIVRGLQKAGCEVRVATTRAAEQFVGAATFEALTSRPVLRDLFDDPVSPTAHIERAEWADLVAVAPCTANVMAKAAAGIADDALTSTLLAAQGPVVLAPAMNVHMWQNPATQANVQTLRSRGVTVVTPDSGRLACGDVGEGKLPPVEELVDTFACVARRAAWPQPLAGKRVVVTAGPTHEAIDPVRHIANSSSGKMGLALARAARDAGADVTLVLGPVALDAPSLMTVVPVTSAAEMAEQTIAAARDADLVISAAAVADYRPAAPADHKLKKSQERLERIDLVETQDILAAVSALAGPRTVVGFAAETDDLLDHARAKLASKGCDLIVANDVSAPGIGFGADDNAVTLISATGEQALGPAPKDDIARAVIDAACTLMTTATNHSEN